MRAISARLKQAELASGVGAGLVGCGVGVLVAAYLQPFVVAILGVGAALHSWGMWGKHRLESATRSRVVWWEALLYWVCWRALLGLAVYIVLRR